jgi:hypothetical protein
MEISKLSIFDEAITLTEKKYTELRMTNKMSKCNTIIINHDNKSFWFSNEKTALFTLNLFNTINSI